ncbi:hypothetical protein ACKWTF_015253 [Chironomus riparius]
MLKVMRFPRFVTLTTITVLILLWIILIKSKQKFVDDVAVLNCKFIKEYSQYTCLVRNLTIKYNPPLKTTVTGEHYNSYQNQDVSELYIYKCFTVYLPYYISNQFPKLINFEVMHSHLRVIERKNFIGLTDLTDLRLDHNEIENVPWNVFYDLKSIVYLSLSDNKILELPGKLLQPLDKLSWFTADRNRLKKLNVDLLNENLKELEAVNFNKNQLSEIFVDFSKIRKLKYVDLQENVCVNVLMKKNYLNREDFVNEIQKKLVNCSVKHVEDLSLQ